MQKPTRGQWRGYALMGVVVAVAIAVLLLKPRSEHRQTADDDHSALQAAVAEYGDAIVQEEARHEAERTAKWHQHGEGHYKSHHSWRHDTAQRDTSRWGRRSERPKRATVNVELNSADSAELTTVHGIGPVFAQRIVRYRTRLGGFVRKEQLLEVRGIDSVRYAQIAPQLTVNSALVHQTDINTASASDLRRHPYLDSWQARELVAWRNRGHRYRTDDDLLMVNTIDSATVAKMVGYLRYGDSVAAPAKQQNK